MRFVHASVSKGDIFAGFYVFTYAWAIIPLFLSACHVCVTLAKFETM